MTNYPIHTGIVKDGKFIPDDAEFFKHDVTGFEGKRIEVIVKESKRADEFNRYYWVGVVPLFVDFFNKEKSFGRMVNKEFVHELLAAKFLGFTQQTVPGGEVVMMRTPSRNLTTHEFWEYVEYCKSWGLEFFNIIFPESPKKVITKIRSV